MSWLNHDYDDENDDDNHSVHEDNDMFTRSRGETDNSDQWWWWPQGSWLFHHPFPAHPQCCEQNLLSFHLLSGLSSLLLKQESTGWKYRWKKDFSDQYGLSCRFGLVVWMFLITSDRYPEEKKSRWVYCRPSLPVLLFQGLFASFLFGTFSPRCIDSARCFGVEWCDHFWNPILIGFKCFQHVLHVYIYIYIYIVNIVYSIYIIYTCVTHHHLSSCLENPGNLLVFVFRWFQPSNVPLFGPGRTHRFLFNPKVCFGKVMSCDSSWVIEASQKYLDFSASKI